MNRPGWLLRIARIPVAGWIAIGMALRLAHALTLGNQYFFGDTPEYQMAALRLLHGMDLAENGPRAPLYPAVMAFSFWLGGEDNFRATRMLQLVLSLVFLVVGTRLARTVGGRGAEVLTAATLALAPTVLFVAGLLYPTQLYMLLIVSITFAAVCLARQPSAGRGVLLGVLAVLAWATDMVVLAPLAWTGLWLLTRLKSAGPALGRALLLAAVTAAAVAAPYALLLKSRHSDRVFMGKAQAVLHYARTDSVISRQRAIRLPSDTPFEALPPGRFVARELGFLRQHPGAYLHDLGMEFFHFFQPIPDRVTSVNRYNTSSLLFLGGLYFVVLLTFAVLGLLQGRGALSERLLLAGVVVATAGFYAFFFTQARYRIPVEPLLAVLAALGIANAFPNFTRALAGPAEEQRGEASGA